MATKIKNKEIAPKGLIKVSGFTLANTLVCLGQEILVIYLNEKNPYESEFVFEKNKISSRIINSYPKGNVLVEPIKFLEARSSVHRQINTKVLENK